MNNFQLDFAGIGAARSGTTWIYECLKEHPQICMSKKEEAGLFNSLKEKNRGIKFYPDSYACNFAHCKPPQIIRGEYSPSYLADFEVLHLIKEHYPNIKIIACLRNPIERAYSQFLSSKVAGEMNRSNTFEEEVHIGMDSDYISFGFYYSQLTKVFELFPKDNVLVLISEDIARNPTKFIQGIYRFLGVDPCFIPSVVNEKVRPIAQNYVKSVLLSRAIIRILDFFRLRPLKPAAVFFKRIGIHKLINFISLANYVPPNRRKPYVKPKMAEETRKRLQEIYLLEIKNLEKLINRDLSFWR